MKKEELERAVKEKLISVQKHPSIDLFIYNYTPKVQYEKLWNETISQCRGLILNGDGEIVAKPFPKFFNIEEHQPNEIPSLPFDVFEKMDGSLGILYWVENTPYMATRGSFTSEQAVHATNILHTKYSFLFDKIDRNSTYLFEIIYPENRIVIDYNGMDDIILLTIINNETGDERIESIGFPIVRKIDGIKQLDKLRELEEDNKEGFVIRFKNNFRVKLKFSEYLRLHKILTNISNITIWEYLKDEKDIRELLERVPDEFYKWVRKEEDILKSKFSEILNESNSSFKVFDTRKETALYFKTQKYPSVLFTILNNQSPSQLIWKMIRPKHSKPFKIDEQ